MKKSLIASFAALSLVLVACTPAGTENSAKENGASSTSVRSSAVRSKTAASSVASKRAAAARVITVEVTSWSFTPSVITAKKGEKVTLKIVGKSGTHGFTVPGLSISQPVSAGQAIEVELPTDKAGTFAFACSIPCGEGHKDMKGSVVIEE